ncbi:MAG: FMN-binding glutamate synthase family protein [Candidatus Omnitrophica bacterium]|nr:FMN-binding glutamate synthase family protein [Candidatus Omnitrophota bacterium]
MNLQRPNANEATSTRNRSRDVAPNSGICTVCREDCTGFCEIFRASFRGREAIYPGPFGEITAGSDKQYPVDYSHLNVMGYALGAKAIDEANPDKAIFPEVDTTAVYGHLYPVRMKMPIFTGALGSTDIARKHWESFAIGAAISGISLVVGENVCGIDPELQVDNKGKVLVSPEMERRVNIYKKWQEDYGDIIVQLNVEDTRLGVAEYVVEKLGVESIELKWGQGAKSIGGEIKIRDIERAKELQKRGYIIIPNPTNPAVQEAFKKGGIKEFERHSRLGFIDEEEFVRTVEYLRRSVGVKRVSLKTGAYGPRELAMAIKWSSTARVDLVTLDGSGGGTGMSPWRMMEEWGIPTFYLQCLAYEFAQKLARKNKWIPDLAMAGGFSTEDHIFKVLAMGAPYFKAVCMGRALMIPGFVGDNIEKALTGKGNGRWETLPATVSRYGTKPEEIFTTFAILKNKYGKKIEDIALGAVAIYTFIDKLKTGLSQLMAGARSFRLDSLSREDLVCLTEEASRVSGIPYIMEAQREEAEKILEGR